MEHFLTEICGDAWNKAQDAGRPIAEGNQLLIDQYPEYKTEILTFYERWVEMLGGPIHETVDILRTLHSNGKARLVALTNWSAETFPIAQSMYDFLGLLKVSWSAEKKIWSNPIQKSTNCSWTVMTSIAPKQFYRRQ